VRTYHVLTTGRIFRLAPVATNIYASFELGHRGRTSSAFGFQSDARTIRSDLLATGGFVIRFSPLIFIRTVPRRVTVSPGASQK
jgi:hypothetical protein